MLIIFDITQGCKKDAILAAKLDDTLYNKYSICPVKRLNAINVR